MWWRRPTRSTEKIGILPFTMFSGIKMAHAVGVDKIKLHAKSPLT
jgi:hypothetical protein